MKTDIETMLKLLENFNESTIKKEIQETDDNDIKRKSYLKGKSYGIELAIEMIRHFAIED